MYLLYCGRGLLSDTCIKPNQNLVFIFLFNVSKSPCTLTIKPLVTVVTYYLQIWLDVKNIDWKSVDKVKF